MLGGRVLGGRVLGGSVLGGRCWVVGVNDMPCCPRETSPRSFHARRPYPRSLTVVVACFAAPPRPFDDPGLFKV